MLKKASHIKTPDSLDSQWFNFKGVTSWIKYSELFFRRYRFLCCRGGFFWAGVGGRLQIKIHELFI